ncbi:fluoride efflux transporter CrcB [Zunongwangia sp.]|uniref:fluoride efflux transporter CrcB n=1 Tax=Zunongwangia sp. TaxID=1965325 RepID=UPI003AA95144
MKNILLVFLGGGLGSIFRYLISKFLNSTDLNIPWGTFAVNIIGSFLIGLFIGSAIKHNNLGTPLYILLATGFCGGFTTFSTFSFENQALFKSGDFLNFIIYAFGSLFLGIIAAAIGLYCSKLT